MDLKDEIGSCRYFSPESWSEDGWILARPEPHQQLGLQTRGCAGLQHKHDHVMNNRVSATNNFSGGDVAILFEVSWDCQILIGNNSLSRHGLFGNRERLIRFTNPPTRCVFW